MYLATPKDAGAALATQPMAADADLNRGVSSAFGGLSRGGMEISRCHSAAYGHGQPGAVNGRDRGQDQVAVPVLAVGRLPNGARLEPATSRRAVHHCNWCRLRR